ncbi:SPOR domain-containing protein [Novosphingobium sp. TH158]|uniref:SPOR domain-containing protein n=1 Tax=Novosphingobium sp. TH158 TaxID=2067455 RepID=UPI000C7CED4E|nr:SPOR domain-containing protein [Novosphingobium sp. TH158]PLK24325.1 sporulation protein [Novosphingobium sp. TH158]
MKLRLLLAGAMLGGLALAGVARADVKAGVDAWARGDFPAAIKEWEGPAGRGDADAQFNLGQAYKWGKGVNQDLKKAELYFGKAAAQGHIEASDNYGLLLFDRGERGQALPYVKAASGRGDPRAQYLLAIMHFNGDLVNKDWVRAYALMSLAQQAGLPQATPGLQQMDVHIPLAQRQQAVSLSQQLAAEAEATRNRQFAADDLGVKNPAGVARTPPQVAAAPVRRQPTPEEAVAEAERVAAGSSPRSAGADYARPATPPPAVAAAPKPVSLPQGQPFPAATAPKPATTNSAAPAPRPAATAAAGSWRIQLGAFGVAANADALWARIKGRPEIAGHGRINVSAGAVTKLQAGGYSEDGARSACRSLAAAGFACAPVRN